MEKEEGVVEAVHGGGVLNNGAEFCRMEPYHGRRGKESSVVCGVQTMLLMFVMAMSVVLVVVWEASPSARSTRIQVPGNNVGALESRINSFPLPNTDEGTEAGDEKSKGHDRSVSHDRLKTHFHSREASPDSSLGVATPNFVDGQTFKDLPKGESLAHDTASGYNSGSELNATRDVEELTKKLDQSSESSTKNVSSVILEGNGEAELEAVLVSPSNRDATDQSLSESTAGIKGDSPIGEETPASDVQSSKPKLCEYTIGKWILDETRPLYSGRECSWISFDFACRRHNHPDKLMDRYRWQPTSCDLPTFNASAALETLRNKVVAFVGDSLGRQQFQSLLCMLSKHGKNVTNVISTFNFYTPRGGRRPTGYAYHFAATNTTVIFKWTVTLAHVQPLNVTSNALHLDRPAEFLQNHLHQLHVLVVNSGHHWNSGKMAQNHYHFHNNNKPVPPSSHLSHVSVAYNQTIHNVVQWLHKHKTRQVIFYRSLSPRHFRNGDWNTGGTCDMIRFEGGIRVQDGMRVDVNAESAVAGTGVRLLNVTSLSLERGETHVSKYGGGKGGQDCLHWCLPGVPDTWNEIMLAELGENLIKPSTNSTKT